MPPYRIMTFDGGGVKGSLMATLVKRLSDKFPNLLQQVDLFAGTSTGSVVALTLASGFSADTLVSFILKPTCARRSRLRVSIGFGQNSAMPIFVLCLKAISRATRDSGI